MSYIDDAFREMDDRGRGKLDRCWEPHVKEFPAGSLNLPPLLDQRRLEHKIPEGAFRFCCAWDYVLVVQIEYDQTMEKLFAGSMLERPQAYKNADSRRSYIGVLCSAGSTALDKLESEGITLGHIVRFMRYTPFQCQIDTLISEDRDVQEFFGVDLVVSDIRASLDLGLGLREGEVKREVREHESGAREHVFVNKDGDVWRPEAPFAESNFL